MSQECKSTVHYRYWLLMMAMILVAVATDRWTGKEGFTSYLSNAATITSLLLGVVAIFYSFVSNSSISNSLGSIGSISDEVSKTNKSVGEYVALAKDIESMGRLNLQSMEVVSTDMRKGLSEFAKLLESMGEKNDSMHLLISGFPKKFDELEIKIADAFSSDKQNSELNSNKEQAKTALGSKTIERFYKRSAPVELIAAYCFVLAHKAKKQVVMKEMVEFVSPLNSSSANFFVRCMDAVGLMSIYGNATSNPYTVSWVNECLASGIRDAIVKAIDKELPSEKEKLLKQLSAAELFYLPNTES
ncbi:hypothetical protein [Pseudomonas sp. NPDC079086]|uniref:hypothetical protein n=1 Tax=unclassified Pseudomonas TaxID=196821 RepID=UPI0037CACDB0